MCQCPCIYLHPSASRAHTHTRLSVGLIVDQHVLMQPDHRPTHTHTHTKQNKTVLRPGEEKRDRGIAEALHAIGSTHHIMNDFQTAIPYLKVRTSMHLFLQYMYVPRIQFKSVCVHIRYISVAGAISCTDIHISTPDPMLKKNKHTQEALEVRKAAAAASKAGEGTTTTIPASERTIMEEEDWEDEEGEGKDQGNEEEEREAVMEMTYTLASTYAKVDGE